MRYLRTEKLGSFHLRPFIVLTIAKRAHYKAEKETTCSVNVLKLVSPNQPDLLHLPNQTHLAFVNVPRKQGTFAHPDIDRVCLRVRWGEVVPHTHIYTTVILDS